MKRGVCTQRIRGRSNRQYRTFIRGLPLPPSETTSSIVCDHHKHQGTFSGPLRHSSDTNHNLLGKSVAETYIQRADLPQATQDSCELQTETLSAQEAGNFTLRNRVEGFFNLGDVHWQRPSDVPTVPRSITHTASASCLSRMKAVCERQSPVSA